MDADGLAFLIWSGLFGLIVLLAALAVETVLGRTDRQWIRRLRRLERGRAQQREQP